LRRHHFRRGVSSSVVWHKPTLSVNGKRRAKYQSVYLMNFAQSEINQTKFQAVENKIKYQMGPKTGRMGRLAAHS